MGNCPYQKELPVIGGIAPSKKIAGPGFEPGSAVPETAVLPLDDPAICELYQVIRLKVMRLVY